MVEDCAAAATTAHAQQVMSEGIGNVEGQTLKSPLLGRSGVKGRAKMEKAVFGLLQGAVSLIEETWGGLLEGVESLYGFGVRQLVFGPGRWGWPSKGGGLWKKGRSGQKNQAPQVIDSVGNKQGYVFAVDGCDNITVGEGAMGAAAELGVNAGKMSLEKIRRLMRRVRLTW
jgi:hypothetical protein